MKNILLFSLLFISPILISFDNTTNLITTIQNGQGRILGQNVIIRSSHSTQSSKKGMLSLNQMVSILDVYYASNNGNEAILKVGTNFYDEFSGNFSFSLKNGKAVKIIEALGNNRYRIAFTMTNGSKGFATITGSNLEFINGDRWYKIQTYNGAVGWVLGKYVQEY
ncbi:MAG: SH3 domain-containing protein [Sphingobacteriales bacterium]|nr:SH3 domain-containing protein [Sphingobacteriales bacterium]